MPIKYFVSIEVKNSFALFLLTPITYFDFSYSIEFSAPPQITFICN